MIRLQSYVAGRWRGGAGDGRPLVNPTTGAVVGAVDAADIDASAAFAHAREKGRPALAALDFAGRAALLGKIADVLVANRESYAEIARINSGNTARDAAIDIDGGIGTLKYYARLGKGLGAAKMLIEEGSDQLTRAETFLARHVWTSRPGIALHINAYNFPSWGLWEKAAVALLAGVPVITKPASATAWLAERMVRDVVEAGVLPEGSLGLVCGSGEALLAQVESFDHIAFTGSAETGRTLRAHARVIAAAPRLSIEADSVNAAILGRDAGPDSGILAIFTEEVVRALTVKAGQLCTNIRRVLVPAERIGAVAERLQAAVAAVQVGDPAAPEVTLGPVVHEAQRRSILAGLHRLAAETTVVAGGSVPTQVVSADAKQGAFVAPTILLANGASLDVVHEVEVFGPALTLLPYRDMTDATRLAARGGGSLAVSFYAEDPAEAAGIAAALAPHHGRVLVVDPVVGKGHSGHAIVMPQCVHGGPGRAGGGEELGGSRGLRFYMQRTALQGSPAMLDAVAASAAKAGL